jgi:thiamine-phosphate pyrophosphorylase
MQNPRFDLSVYFVADPSLCMERDVADIVRAAVTGGATMVQLRNKSGNILELLEQAQKLRNVLRPLNVPFIINDRVDVAKEMDADGVHLGQGDMNPAEARKILGTEKIIGITAFTVNHFKAIDPDIIDYAGTGPFYPTKTDKGKPVMGAAKFSALVKISPVPVVGIGGVTPDSAPLVIKSGAAGVAMMRAISETYNPEQAARNFASAVSTARQRKAS